MLEILAGHHGAPRFLGGGGFLVLLATMFAVATWPFFGGFATGAALVGAAVGAAMRSWHDRHPATLAPKTPIESGRMPEINLSAIPVGGDAGGLMFAAGSMLIVMLGLPELRWFFAAAVACSALVAGAVFLWRRAHPPSSRGDCSITLR